MPIKTHNKSAATGKWAPPATRSAPVPGAATSEFIQRRRTCNPLGLARVSAAEDGRAPGAMLFFRLLPLCLLVALLAGCAGYQLGPVNGVAAGERTVQVRPFVNETFQPRLTDPVTSQVRKQLQRDGTFKLASHDDGDIVVTGTLVKYDRIEVTLNPNDVLTVQDYRLVLTAHVTAYDRSAGKTILTNETVSGYTLMRVGSDLTSAERQAMPLLAEDLAKNLVALLAEGKWW